MERCGTCENWEYARPMASGTDVAVLGRCSAGCSMPYRSRPMFGFKATGLSDDEVEFHTYKDGPPWPNCRYYKKAEMKT